MSYDAIQLFAARATAVQSRFALSDQNAPAVAQICQRLDGIPLAIELATARLKLFSAEQIAARLDDRFRLLTGGSRTALPRQQTLSALIDWSYDLLSEPERVLLRRLSVFAGGWSFEAADEVCSSQYPLASSQTVDEGDKGRLGEIGGNEVLDLLAQLVNKSLVVADDPDENGEVRYRYLETIRQYAREKLLASGEAGQVRDRHLAWFVRLSEEAWPHLLGREQIEWQHRLAPDNDNFRAALAWALESNPVGAVRLAGGLYFYWAFGGSDGEGRHWIENALTAAEPLALDDADPEWRAIHARALVGLGNLTFGQGEIQKSLAPLRKGLVLARSTADVNVRVWAISMTGFAESMSGNTEAGSALAHEALAVMAQSPEVRFDPSLVNGILVREAQIVKHDNALAKRYVEEGLERTRVRGNPFSRAMTLFGTAMYRSMAGETESARTLLLEAQELMRQMGNRPRVIGIQSEIAHTYRREGNLTEATRLYRDSLMALQEFGHRGGVARNLECLAFVASARRQPLRAARLIGAAEALRDLSQVAMMPEERPETALEVAAMRAQVPAAQFEAAWAEGRAMDMDQAIQYALKDD